MTVKKISKRMTKKDSRKSKRGSRRLSKRKKTNPTFGMNDYYTAYETRIVNDRYPKLLGLVKNLDSFINEYAECVILKLFLEKRKVFEQIRGLIPDSFYTKVFKCHTIFKTDRQINEEKEFFINQSVELIKALPSNVVRSHIMPFAKPNVILDSVIELTKNHVNVGKQITNKKTGEPIYSIYENRNKNAQRFWADENTEEGMKGRERARELRIIK